MLDGEIDEHNCIFLDYANQQNRTQKAIQVQRSLPKASSHINAPNPAEGSPDKIVKGWMKLS